VLSRFFTTRCVRSNNALHRTGLALRARPTLASLGAGERGRWAPQ